MKLWHCYNSRSVRVLWALEEMGPGLGWVRGVDYEVETIPFPPRVFQKEFLDVNPLGTVPYFMDGDVTMTESTAVCLYLVEKYGQIEGRAGLGLNKDHPDYPDYLNWLFQSDATLTFPTAIALRYSAMEPKERRQPQVVQDYAKWFLGRLRWLDRHIEGRDFLCAGRFTIADIAVGYALHLGEVVGLADHYSPQVAAYLKRLQARDGFKRCQAVDPDQDPFKGYTPKFTVEPREKK